MGTPAVFAVGAGGACVAHASYTRPAARAMAKRNFKLSSTESSLALPTALGMGRL